MCGAGNESTVGGQSGFPKNSMGPVHDGGSQGSFLTNDLNPPVADAQVEQKAAPQNLTPAPSLKQTRSLEPVKRSVPTPILKQAEPIVDTPAVSARSLTDTLGALNDEPTQDAAAQIDVPKKAINQLMGKAPLSQSGKVAAQSQAGVGGQIRVPDAAVSELLGGEKPGTEKQAPVLRGRSLQVADAKGQFNPELLDRPDGAARILDPKSDSSAGLRADQGREGDKARQPLYEKKVAMGESPNFGVIEFENKYYSSKDLKARDTVKAYDSWKVKNLDGSGDAYQNFLKKVDQKRRGEFYSKAQSESEIKEFFEKERTEALKSNEEDQRNILTPLAKIITDLNDLANSNSKMKIDIDNFRRKLSRDNAISEALNKLSTAIDLFPAKRNIKLLKEFLKFRSDGTAKVYEDYYRARDDKFKALNAEEKELHGLNQKLKNNLQDLLNYQVRLTKEHGNIEESRYEDLDKQLKAFKIKGGKASEIKRPPDMQRASPGS